MSGFSMIVKFQDPSESYVNGFEAGQLFSAMQDGGVLLPSIVHTSNIPTLRAIAENFGFIAEFKDSPVAGWSEVEFSRPQLPEPKKVKLTLVKP